MNGKIIFSGAGVAAVGVAMNILLSQLAQETFRADRSIWVNASYGFVLGGLVLITAGVFAGRSEPIRISTIKASRHFATLALINTVAGAIFAIPLLIPSLDFPILITRWPGIYMVAAYVFFVIISVLGNVAWASLLTTLRSNGAMEVMGRWALWAQLALTETCVYTLSVFMFYGGYIGASLVYSGAQEGIVGVAMEFTVIPVALSIFGIIVGELLGVWNIAASSGKTTSEELSATSASESLRIHRNR